MLQIKLVTLYVHCFRHFNSSKPAQVDRALDPYSEYLSVRRSVHQFLSSAGGNGVSQQTQSSHGAAPIRRAGQ